MLDTGLATCAAMDSYQRLRPFVLQKEAACAPAEEAALVKDGSYPSGHAAIGWGWALLLAEFGAAKAELTTEPWPAASGGADSGAAATKLELAKAYVEIGDSDGAKEILQEVVREGSAAQQSEAKKLLAGL